MVLPTRSLLLNVGKIPHNEKVGCDIKIVTPNPTFLLAACEYLCDAPVWVWTYTHLFIIMVLLVNNSWANLQQVLVDYWKPNLNGRANRLSEDLVKQKTRTFGVWSKESNIISTNWSTSKHSNLQGQSGVQGVSGKPGPRGLQVSDPC